MLVISVPSKVQETRVILKIGPTTGQGESSLYSYSSCSCKKTEREILHIMQDVYDEESLTSSVVFCSPLPPKKKNCIKAGSPQ